MTVQKKYPLKKAVIALAFALTALSVTGCGDIGNQTGTVFTTYEKADPQVLVNQAGIKVTYTGLGKGSDSAKAMNLTIENRSGEDVWVYLADSSVNGYMVANKINVEIPDGKTAKTNAVFDAETMKNCGIDTIADIEFSIVAVSADGGGTLVKTKPMTVKTSAAAGYTYSYDESGVTLYDQNSVKIVAQKVITDESGSQSVAIYTRNDTDSAIYVSPLIYRFEGTESDMQFGAYVNPGKHSVDLITFYEPVEKLSEMSLCFMVTDTEGEEEIGMSRLYTLSVDENGALQTVQVTDPNEGLPPMN